MWIGRFFIISVSIAGKRFRSLVSYKGIILYI